MQKFIGIVRLVGFALALIVIGFLTLSRPALAKSKIDPNLRCGLLASDSGIPINLVTDKFHVVVTKSGNASLVCHFRYRGEGLPKRAIKLKNFPCSIFENVTNISRLVITPAGQIHLVCKIKGHERSPSQALMADQVPHFETSGTINP
jgi:hypothetical protein